MTGGNQFKVLNNEQVSSIEISQRNSFSYGITVNDSVFDVKFDIDPDIDSYNVNIPSMILQPILENSIWHGIMPLDSKGEIFVEIKQTSPEAIQVKVQDNGVGFEIGQSNSKHSSYGSKLISERLELLRKYYKRDFSFAVSSTAGEGTLVNINFPSNL